MPPRTLPLLGRDVLEELYFQRRLSIPRIAEMTGTNIRLVRDSFTAHGLTWRSKSEARMGMVYSPETCAKISAVRKGKRDRPEVAARKAAILDRAGGRGWNKGLTKFTDARMAKLAESFGAAIRRPEVRTLLSRKASERLRTGAGFRRGWHVSPRVGRVWFMSSWERKRFEELDDDDDVLSYEPQPVAIPYFWRGAVCRYTPDLLILYKGAKPVLEEIKPRKIIAADKTGRIAAKLAAGRLYAESQGWDFRLIDEEPGR